MIKHYFKIAWRNLFFGKRYSLVNNLGLAVGIAACILIGLFVYNETSFDKNIPGRERVFRLNEYVHYDGTAPQLSAAIGPPIGSFLKNEHNEIESYTRVFPATPFIYPSLTLEYAGKKIKTSQLACTDSTFADMFGVEIVEGNKSDFATRQNSIVLTKSMAQKFFGNETAINKMLNLRVDDTTVYHAVVTNVIKDFPKTSHLQVEGLIPVPEDFEQGFLGNNYGVLLGPTYLRLRPGADASVLEAKLTNTIHAKNKFIDMRLQAVSEVHSGSTDINYDYFNYKKIDGKYVRIFIIIALAIFIIACINFINLTIAMAAYRGKEIAVKKIVGAGRLQIIFQVLAETFFSVLISVLLSVLLAFISLPYLDNILDIRLATSSLVQPPVIAAYIIVILLATLLAGLYPSLLISSSRIDKSLKSKILFGGSRTSLRNVLVTGQFAVAIIFIVGLTVFLKQLSFLEKKNLGYSYSQVIKVPLDVQDAAKLPVLESELLKNKNVLDVTNGYIELGGKGSLFGIDYVAPDGQNKHISVNFENAGTNYVGFFDMKIVKGHDFNKDSPGNQYLINETLAKQIGYENPVGRQINLSSFPPGVITGVVNDFNYGSLHTKIEPLIISSISDVPVWQSQLYIKVSTTGISETLKDVTATLKSISGSDVANVQFLDEHFKEIYASEKRAGTIVAIIGSLAITIACLGLLSLAAFVIVKKRREVSIRKVLGASVPGIVSNLSGEFVKLIIIAFVIAVPIAYWIMNNWLQGFAYRVAISWWMFALAGALTIGIAFIVVGVLSLKAAVANPVKSLRAE